MPLTLGRLWGSGLREASAQHRGVCVGGRGSACLASSGQPWSGERGPYLGRDAPQARGVAPAAGVRARGPRDGLVVEDGEGGRSVSDQHGLERVDLPRRGLSRGPPPAPQSPAPHPRTPSPSCPPTGQDLGGLVLHPRRVPGTDQPLPRNCCLAGGGLWGPRGARSRPGTPRHRALALAWPDAQSCSM